MDRPVITAVTGNTDGGHITHDAYNIDSTAHFGADIIQQGSNRTYNGEDHRQLGDQAAQFN